MPDRKKPRPQGTLPPLPRREGSAPTDDRVCDRDEVYTEYEPTYRDGSAVNECWRQDEG